MKPSYLVTFITAAAICVAAALLLGATDPKNKPWPKPTPPPPPSPIYQDSREPSPSTDGIGAQVSTRYPMLEREIEHALVAGDARRRETVFTFLLPELIQIEPNRAAAMFARQPPGEARDTLRTEMTLQWLARDPESAVEWMKSLPEGDRRASALAAVQSIKAIDPRLAMRLASEFDLRLQKGAAK